MSRSLGGTSFTTRSPIEIVPWVMLSRPATIRSAVVLPQPGRADQHDELLVVDVESRARRRPWCRPRTPSRRGPTRSRPCALLGSRRGAIQPQTARRSRVRPRRAVQPVGRTGSTSRSRRRETCDAELALPLVPGRPVPLDRGLDRARGPIHAERPEQVVAHLDQLAPHELVLSFSRLDASHRIQSQKCWSIPSRVSALTDHGGSDSYGSSGKIRSTFTGPASISM